MNYLTIRNTLSPIHDAEQEIRRRYERLNLPLPFEVFRARTAAVAPAIITEITPKFFTQLNPNFPRGCVNLQQFHLNHSGTKHARRVEDLLIELQRALLLCIIAKLPTPKPLVTVLDDALRYCAAHDAHLARHAQEDDAAKQRCTRGGQARHRDHRRIQRLTIRLLRTMAPDTLWMSKAHAAKTISPHLCGLGVKYRFAVSGAKETWARNVVKLIRTDSQATQVFQRHCTPRRTNRCRRIPR